MAAVSPIAGEMRIESRNSVQTRHGEQAGERYTPDGGSELVVLVFEQDVGHSLIPVAPLNGEKSERVPLFCDRGRVKGFAPRGCSSRKRADVLRLPVAFRERQRVLHRLLDGLEEALGGAYAGRFIGHEITRSMEACLL